MQFFGELKIVDGVHADGQGAKYLFLKFQKILLK